MNVFQARKIMLQIVTSGYSAANGRCLHQGHWPLSTVAHGKECAVNGDALTHPFVCVFNRYKGNNSNSLVTACIQFVCVV
jgi:hypothetical protein